MTAVPTLGELARNQDRLFDELSQHVQDCARLRQKNADALQTIRDYMVGEMAARKAGQEERQRQEDAQTKRLQRVYWMTGISMAGLALLQIASLWQRTGNVG